VAVIGREESRMQVSKSLGHPAAPRHGRVPGVTGRVTAVLVVLGLTACAAYGQGVVINEVMALNASTLADESGQYGDWLELYNPAAQAADVGGMYLSDDLQKPTSWRIPTGTTIPAGGYLLFWADGTGTGRHAGFKLSSDGEALGLFAKDGTTLIDSVEFPSQRTDISYGRDPANPGAWKYLTYPTPGKHNAAAFTDVVEDLTLSHTRGFYDQAFSLELVTATAGATIVYTLDGSDPCDPFRGFSPTAKTYDRPIAISTTTCLRAMACRAGWLPSHAATHTYLFVKDVVRQSQAAALAAGYPSMWSGYPADYEMDPQVTNDPAYSGQMADALRSIPVVSIVTDREYLFDPSIGIYTNSLSEGDGLEWERPVSMELFQADGAKEVQIDCGIRIQGGHSRRPEKDPKHSFGLRFRAEYGHTSLDYPLFDDTPIKSFDSLQLRGVFNNAWTHWDPGQRTRAQYVRDHWGRNSLTAMGNPDALQGFSVHLYLDGLYWGLYMLHERPSASHYAAYNGGDPDAIDAVNGDPTYIISDPLNTGQLSEGTLDAWLELKAVVASRDWDEIQKVLDVDNFIDWTILNYYGGNIDLKQGTNWRAAGGGPDRRPWRFYIWDGERILENVNETTVGVDDATGLFTALCSIDEFCVRFGDRVHKHLFNGGALTSEPSAQRYTKRSDAIELAVIAESARWGDYRRDLPAQYQYGTGPYDLYTKDRYWTPEKNRLLTTYFPARTDFVVNLFRNFKPRPLYPGVGAPVFNIDGTYQHGGHVLPTDALSMTLPQGTTGKIYYTLDGSDPRVPGTSAEETATLVAATAAKRVLVPTAAVSDTWRGGGTFNDSAWTAVTGAPGGVGFDTNPSQGGDYTSYISLNVSGSMSGKNTTCYIRIPFTIAADDLPRVNALTLRILYDDGFVAYLNGTEVQRQGFNGTPTWNSRASASHTAGATPAELDVSGSLGSLHAGDNILAIHLMNRNTTDNDVLMWAELLAGLTPVGGIPVAPTAAEYTGPIHLQASTPVKARTLSGGAWSALNEAVYAVGPVAQSLRISEIMYHPEDTGNPDDPNTEFIELTNIGSQTIHLNLVRFTNGVDFTFPDIALEPGGYTLAVKDATAFSAKYGPGLPIAGTYSGSLDNGGERIRLEDALGEPILDFEYKDGWYRSTDGQGCSLVLPDPKTTDPADYADKVSWRASHSQGGSPGLAD
jgi:hypothetical protein